MIHRKSILGFGIVTVMVLIAATTLSISTIILNAHAQNGDTSQQVRDYLIQAIQALDSGDNTKAIQQLQLAGDQMGALTGVSVQTTGSTGSGSNNDNGGSGGSDDSGEESEEGEGEDEDEPGDTDLNDEED
jgi:hypothetical protein